MAKASKNSGDEVFKLSGENGKTLSSILTILLASPKNYSKQTLIFTKKIFLQKNIYKNAHTTHWWNISWRYASIQDDASMFLSISHKKILFSHKKPNYQFHIKKQLPYFHNKFPRELFKINF